MVFTAQASVIAHQREKGVSWSIYQHVFPGIAFGTVIGTALTNQIPTQWLKIILSFFLLFIASEMIFKPHFSTRTDFPTPWINRFVSVMIGLKSGLLGIGGGALIIPYLSYCGVERRQTAGISAMCTLTVALIGSVMFMITGLISGESTYWSTGYVYWPAVLWIAIPSMIFAPIGAYFTYRLPIDYLKYAFIVVLVIAAIDLLRQT